MAATRENDALPNRPGPNLLGVTRLFYVDESRDAGHHYQVGLLVDGPQVRAVEAALDDLVVSAFLEGGAEHPRSELHGKDVFHGEKAWQKGPIAQRSTVLENALSLIPQHGVEVIARGADLSRFKKRYPGTDPYRWEFSNLLERLNERLKELNDYGLVIADQQHDYRALLQQDVADGKQYGTGGYRSQKLVRVLDTAHFVESQLSRLVQLADMAAFVLRRRATIPTERDARLEALMARLFALVEDGIPNPKGQYHTIRWS